jgi:hypothetical protein
MKRTMRGRKRRLRMRMRRRRRRRRRRTIWKKPGKTQRLQQPAFAAASAALAAAPPVRIVAC